MKKHLTILIISIMVALFFGYYIFSSFNNIMCSPRPGYGLAFYECNSYEDALKEMQHNGHIRRVYLAGTIILIALGSCVFSIYKIKDNVR